MNDFLEDIILRAGYLKERGIFKMTATALGPKVLSRTKIVNVVVTLIASRSDCLTEICFSPN